MLRSSTIWFFLLLAILAVAPRLECQENWWDFYDLALKDIRAKNWSLAEERLKAAYRLNPEQGEKVRTYGARFIRYFPEYYLGVVHFHQGKHQAALEEFLRIENKGLIQSGDEEYNELTKLKQQAFAKLNPPSTRPDVPAVDQQYASLIEKAQSSLISGRYEEARNSARQAIALDKNNPKAVDLLKKIDLADSVAQLRLAIDRKDLGLAQQLAKRVEELDPGNPDARRVAQLVASARTAEEQEKHEQQFTNLMQQAQREYNSGDYQRARKTLEKARSVPGADASTLQQLARTIDAREASERKAEAKPEPPQQELKPASKPSVQQESFAKATMSFYRGNYRESASLLERAIANGSASAKGHFYLGCSYAALAFLQQQTNEGTKERDELLRKAKEQFAVSRKLNASLNHDQRFISPRILQIYESIQ